MKELRIKYVLTVVTLATIAWYSLLFITDSLNQEQKQLPPSASTCTQPLVANETIADFSKIPQDIHPFAATIHGSMSAAEQSQILPQFHERYFAPWTATEPLFNINMVTEGVKALAGKTWYGENRRIVEPKHIQSLLFLADLDRLPSINQLGVVTKPTFIRVLPTIRPFYKTPDDFPFDHLQFSEIKPNEPVRILHASKDGAWLYIETSYANGWVEPDAVRLANEALQKRMLNSAQIVIVKDFPVIRTEQGKVLPQPKIGTLYPLVKEEANHWLVDVTVAENNQHAALITARIAKSDARHHPLPFTAEAVTLVGNELLKTPYGWGELYRNRDCSATTRDFFLSFGIWLPRNSMKQITSGPFLPLAGLSSANKEKIIREQGIPFRTLVHQKGHVMLYVGLHEGKPTILHTVWALRYKPKNCPEKKFYIGDTVLSTLEAGKELPLSKGTTLDQLDGLLLLPVQGALTKTEP
jgi:hypothetical protein